MIDRFTGDDGNRRALELLVGQRLISGNIDLAKELLDSGEILEAKSGEAFIEQGSSDNSIFFLLAGQADIFVNGRKVNSRHAGTYVGEMALIDHSSSRSATVIPSEGCILLKISEEKFSPIANKNPDIWRFLASELADRLRQRGSLVSKRSEVPELFIGCSSESLEVGRAIQNGFSHDKVTPVLWTNGVFGASNTTIESLVQQLKRTDFAVILLTPDDLVHSREKEDFVPRDNVIFELGLFIGRIGRERVFLVKEINSQIKMPTDLLGVTPLEYKDQGANMEARTAHVCNKIRERINELGAF